MSQSNIITAIIAIIAIVIITFVTTAQMTPATTAPISDYPTVGVDLEGEEFDVWYTRSSLDNDLSEQELQSLASLMIADSRYETQGLALRRVLNNENLVGFASEDDESEDDKVTIRDLFENIEVEDDTVWYTTTGSVDVGAGKMGDGYGVSVRIKF